MSSPEPLPPGTSDSREPFSFVEFASGLGLNKFAAALEAANLTSSYVDVCQSELTLFAPTDDAFDRLGANLPTDVLLLRELMCVHITLGNFSGVELMKTRSITTINQQTHHINVPATADEMHALDSGAVQVTPRAPVAPHRARAIIARRARRPLPQVGTASLVRPNIALPDGRGVLHTTDSVMSCLRLLQHCRFEQARRRRTGPRRPAPHRAAPSHPPPLPPLRCGTRPSARHRRLRSRASGARRATSSTRSSSTATRGSRSLRGCAGARSGRTPGHRPPTAARCPPPPPCAPSHRRRVYRRWPCALGRTA